MSLCAASAEDLDENMATTARRIRVDLVRKFILSYVSGVQCIRRTHVRLYFPRRAIRCPKCGIKGATP
jgi:hypothetical protein